MRKIIVFYLDEMNMDLGEIQIGELIILWCNIYGYVNNDNKI